ncbi:DnaJ domain-containing protein [Mucilaginibacter sp. Bleaf8]|uniref:DnaJ domain-containing protein n=1 Tax=Mucilaginibacter sp. Bleaf8 TaxID=2834430 RepID=UPI001BD1AC17|nr:DnaJ domain-containing protein [Mucilaginibacter sp. Bleaf8]MBS7564879.1 DnaJ domain-containing protein [Mucilaginibacter sp. Bleaf8]
MKDFYYILGVDADCSAFQLKEAYDKLSQKFHPDHNPDDPYFINRFQDVREAYDVLSDPAKRSHYDKKLRAAGLYRTSKGQRKRRSVSGTTIVNILFTIMLIAITAIFGSYVFKAIGGSKKEAVVVKQSANQQVATLPAKHIKKKRRYKVKHNQVVNTANFHKPANTVARQAVKVLPANVTEPVSIKPQPVVPATRSEVADYLYTTYLKGNETGVINMRDDRYFNAQIVKVIPTRSKVWVIEDDGNYYKVRFDNTVGYVPAWTVVK